MREREDNDAVLGRPIYDRKGKVFEKYSSSILGGRRPGEREGEGTSGCFLDCFGEARAEAGLLIVVVNDLGEELTTCCRYEPGPFQRDKRLASAKTSSAA